jgi:AmmeMemoRadiSam system protein B
MKREPVVSGSFYPGTPSILHEELGKYIRFAAKKKKVVGLIVPHAGYVFSGRCAGKGFGSVEIPGTVIILGVNHHNIGHAFAVDGHDYWKTPLGEVQIAQELREKLTAASALFKVDTIASSQEHSIEVQAPFIQYIDPNARILPISIALADIKRLVDAGKEIAALVKDNPDVLIVASTDMSHYISAERARDKDKNAIAKIENLDPEGLYNTVMTERISMCGMAGTVVMLTAALALGATKAEVIDYTNSGVVMGDYNRVVAYLSMMVY